MSYENSTYQARNTKNKSLTVYLLKMDSWRNGYLLPNSPEVRLNFPAAHETPPNIASYGNQNNKYMSTSSGVGIKNP